MYTAEDFETGLKIYKLCSENNVPVDYARLMVYINMKIKTNGDECFYITDEMEILALNHMLGRDTTIKFKDDNPIGAELNNITKIISTDTFKNAKSELVNRLLMHTNDDFRDNAMIVYNNVIVKNL